MPAVWSVKQWNGLRQGRLAGIGLIGGPRQSLESTCSHPWAPGTAPYSAASSQARARHLLALSHPSRPWLPARRHLSSNAQRPALSTHPIPTHHCRQPTHILPLHPPYETHPHVASPRWPIAAGWPESSPRPEPTDWPFPTRRTESSAHQRPQSPYSSQPTSSSQSRRLFRRRRRRPAQPLHSDSPVTS